MFQPFKSQAHNKFLWRILVVSYKNKVFNKLKYIMNSPGIKLIN